MCDTLPQVCDLIGHELFREDAEVLSWIPGLGIPFSLWVAMDDYERGHELAAAAGVIGVIPLGKVLRPVAKTLDIAVIGRLPDTAAAKTWAGHEVLDIPDWTIAKNDAWVEGVIRNGQKVYVGSPMTYDNLWDAAKNRPRAFGRELNMFLNAGYAWDGYHLVPTVPAK